jgi:hypothetical protein
MHFSRRAEVKNAPRGGMIGRAARRASGKK